MRASEFLHTVLPDDGYLIVATLGKYKGSPRATWWNIVVDDIPAMQAKSRTWVEEKRDVYFALASYQEREVWNPTKIDFKTKKQGAFEKRTQANVKSLRSLFLDLDVDDKAGAKKYPTQRAAAEALIAFCKEVKLPKPLMVNSGYGIHVYWPLTLAVPGAEWKAVAEKLKTAGICWGLKQDANVTADEARVLRIPGTTNFKFNTEVPVEVVNTADTHDLSQLDAALDLYLADKAVPKAATKVSTTIPGKPVAPMAGRDNLGATSDPLNGNLVVYACPAMAKLVANRGATASEPQWRAGLALARYCDDSHTMMLAVSDGHPDFNEAAMQAKTANMTAGPTKCATFWAEDNATCEGCQHWTKIKSPSQVGRAYRETAPPPIESVTVQPPPLPWPYMRNQAQDGSMQIIARLKGDDDDEAKDTVVCPYDLYPSRIMEQTEDDVSDERSTWIVHLPRQAAREFKMPQSMLSDPRKLHAFLLSRGLHINPKEAKSTQFYMTAYLKELAKQADRERMYERLGWHEKYRSFVLPNAIYHRDGASTPHAPSRAIEAVTKSGIHTEGTLEGWKQAMQFYAGPNNAGYRTFTYMSWGSPLLHMTTQKGVLIAAAGDTGRGKTTLLEACASIWGNPEALLVGGGKYGATMNAMWSILGTYHSLPMFWDDTTDRDPEEMSDFMLHISTGKGKERMHGNAHDGKIVTWETMVLSSANTDDVHRVMAAGKDRAPHLMRFVSVEFDTPDRSTETKLRADAFKRGIRDNYGHGGPIFIQYVVENYDRIKELVIQQMERFDRLLDAKSEERHWAATLAVSYVGGRLAYRLGLTPFDPKDDEAWMVAHVQRMRLTYSQAASTPADILNQFLEAHVSNTLILSPKQSSHVDNIVNRPHSATGLKIRNEVDTGLIYISRSAINEYCTEIKANFGKLEAELGVCGILRRRNCHKVLGADSPYAMGQTRCWEIDRTVLGSFTGRK